MQLKSSVVSIAPEVDTFLGCGPTESVAGDLAAALEANLLMLKSGGSQVLIISLDALYPGARLRSDIISGLDGLLDDESLFLSSSHTHNAPMLDDSKPLLGSVVDSHYLMVARKIIAASKRLLTDGGWASVELKQARYQLNGVASRRRQAPRPLRALNIFSEDAMMLPNPKEVSSTTAEVLLFSEDDKTLATLLVGACHPVSTLERSALSADYVGSIREFCREEIAHNNAMTFVFLQGASGEVRPNAISRRPSTLKPRDILFSALIGKTFGKFDSNSLEEWSIKRCREFQDAATHAVPSADTSISVARAVLPLEEFFEHPGPQKRFVSVHAVRLGTLTFLGISAEPTWEFAQALVWEKMKGAQLSIVGCIDDTWGYLASRNQCRLGGYEVSGYLKPFSLAEHKTSSETSERIEAACLALLAEL